MTGMAVCVLLLSVFFQDLGGQAGVLRYQQHRGQPRREVHAHVITHERLVQEGAVERPLLAGLHPQKPQPPGGQGVEENRLDLREYEPGDPVLSYLVRIEPYTNPGKVLDNFSHYSYRMEPGRHLELLYPGVANQTRQVREYVQADYNEAERMPTALPSHASISFS